MFCFSAASEVVRSQVSALQSAMPMFGTAYALGLSYGMKIRGGIMVGRRSVGKLQSVHIFHRATTGNKTAFVRGWIAPF